MRILGPSFKRRKNAFSLMMGLVLIFFFEPSVAFESFPEFTTFTEEDLALSDLPFRFPSDYSAILLSYEKPFWWEHQWLTQAVAFDSSIGSLDGSHFLINNRAKLRGFLMERLEFRFTYFAEQNFERNSLFHILELVYWPRSFFGISLYGEPFFLKRKNNIGAAVIVKPHERHEIRFFTTFVNVVRNDRNDQNDGFVPPNFPYVIGIVGRTWGDKDFCEYAFRYDTFTRWNFPTASYEFDYWKKTASLFGQKYLSPDHSLSLRLQFDQRYESWIPTSASSAVASQTWRKDRWQTIARSTWYNVGPGHSWNVTSGLALNTRDWYGDAGEVTFMDLVPHIIGQWAHWSAEYDLLRHQESGPDSLRPLSPASGVYQSRLDISYDFEFANQAVLRLMGTFNPDFLFSGKPWGGGNGQLRMDF